MRRCPGAQTHSDDTMKLAMLLIPVLFLTTSVEALATPPPPLSLPAARKCQTEKPGTQCRDQGATQHTCASHFYTPAREPPVWMQCVWSSITERCEAGGPR